jgi:hypothetical protein
MSSLLSTRRENTKQTKRNETNGNFWFVSFCFVCFVFSYSLSELASHHIEGESGSDQRVVLFDEVVRVPEAAVASLRR